MATTTFMTNDEYGKYKKYADFATFVAEEGYPTEVALNQFREDIWGWMVGFIGSTNARTTYDSFMQFKLRNIEYRGVELMISGEIAKNKIENYIGNSITELFGETDKAEADAADETGNRGVCEG